jgi:hypothetical protein
MASGELNFDESQSDAITRSLFGISQQSLKITSKHCQSHPNPAPLWPDWGVASVIALSLDLQLVVHNVIGTLLHIQVHPNLGQLVVHTVVPKGKTLLPIDCMEVIHP